MQAPTTKLAPSILAADFTRLGEQIREAEAAGVDCFHIDIMDGQFVPNITFGPLIVQAVRSITALPLDIHLMIVEPDRYLDVYAAAGADILTVHAEACRHLHRTLTYIRSTLGRRAGVALNPATGLHAIEEVLPELDWVTIMSVNPGFGGQQFIESVLPKIERLHQRAFAAGHTFEICVDGGVKEDNAQRVAKAGASVLVSGTGIYRRDVSVRDAVAALRQSLAGIQVEA